MRDEFILIYSRSGSWGTRCLSPATVRPFAAGGPRVWGHSRFSPAAFGPRAGHLSVQHFTLHQPGQGRQGLSFVAEGAAAHDSVRLHISVWGISPPTRPPWGGIIWSPLSCVGPDALGLFRPTAVPSWDLSVVLEGLVTAPFESLESASDRILTLKVFLLLALTSLKRVEDLQAFSVSETCMDFAPGLVKVTLRPRPGYIPKVLSTSFRSQMVTLHSFHPPPFASSEDERLHLLCPVRALKLYVDRSKVWRKSPQLLICFGAGRRGLATSKQRISHWVRDAISLAYEARNLPSPLSLRAHSTRGVASSQALFRGVPLEDICVAAGWSSPHTFVRFYSLDVDTAPGSQVLSV